MGQFVTPRFIEAIHETGGSAQAKDRFSFYQMVGLKDVLTAPQWVLATVEL